MIAPVTLLAIDPAKISGWAIFIDGIHHSSGHAITYVDRADAIHVATCCASVASLPLIIIAESWTFGGSGNDPRATASMQAGLQAQWGMWKLAIEEADTRCKVVRVNSRRWQSQVLTGYRSTSEQLKRLARLTASRLAGHAVEEENEADAICIGYYGTRADEVMAALSIAEGKRCGVDVAAARSRVDLEKTKKKQARAHRSRKVAK